jgi:hypothetical protein
LHARLAADAAVGVEVDDAIVSFVESRGRANLDTGGVGAVIAPHDREEPLGLGPGALLDVLDPGAIDAKGNVVLGFTGNRAGMTTNAVVLIDYKPVPQL